MYIMGKLLEELIRINVEGINKAIKNVRELDNFKIFLFYNKEYLIVADNKDNVYYFKDKSILGMEIGMEYKSQKNFLLEILSNIFIYVVDENNCVENKKLTDIKRGIIKKGYVSIHYIDDRELLISDDIKSISELPQIPCKKLNICFLPNLKSTKYILLKGGEND